MKLRSALLGAAAVALFASLGSTGAVAAVTIDSGQDDGASDSGPWPMSAAAETSFKTGASSYGGVYTETFETIPVGTAAGGGTFAIPGASVSITTPFSNPFGGISNIDDGSLYGFNITAGGSQWLGFDNGSATFTFSKPTNSFGFYTTGIQTEFTSTFTAAYNGSDGQTLNIPINVNGGASYFGFTDPSAFTSVTITDLGGDAWGLDNLSYNFTGVPEPATWAMMLLGISGLGALLRTRRQADRNLATLAV
jgi:hypothetical protein